MSVQAIGWVFDHSPTRGTDRLVMLAIANYAGKNPEDGAWESWPGVETIRREAGLDRKRTVMDSLSRLTEGGHVERIINGAPDERIRRDHRPNLYRILLDNGETCGDARCGWCGETPGAGRGDAGTSNGETRGDVTGRRGASPEPLEEPLENRKDEPRGVSALIDVLDPEKQDPVLLVFNAWIESTGKKAKLDEKRRKKIATALKSYPPEDLMDAVRGWKWSPHHCGYNDRGTVYNDLELLLRDASKIETFRDWERNINRPAARVMNRAEQRDASTAAAAREVLQRRQGTPRRELGQ